MANILTDRQKRILEFLKDFIRGSGYPPSLRDICARFKMNNPKSAAKHLTALEKKGFIRRTANASRAIEVFGLNNMAGNVVAVPVAGSVRAGSPELAVEDVSGRVSLDERFFRCAGAFLLKVKGESMTGAGIDDGDYALVRPQKIAESGDIVVAIIEGEATVKRFLRKGRAVILKPENPDMRPITVSGGDFHIVGKVISVIKTVMRPCP